MYLFFWRRIGIDRGMNGRNRRTGLRDNVQLESRQGYNSILGFEFWKLVERPYAEVIQKFSRSAQ